MSQYVVLTDDQQVLSGKTHRSRMAAMRFAEEITGNGWVELLGAGYRIRRLAGRAPQLAVITLSVDLPPDVMHALELQAAVVGMTASHLASLVIGGAVSRQQRGGPV